MADLLRPRIPDGLRIYAVGDIHGRADLLAETFGRIDADRATYATPRAVEIYLGDYIDRGPASREVIDLLIDRAKRQEIVCLKGNHEDIALQFLNAPQLFSTWARIGGRETLMSYGLNPVVRRTDEMAALARAFRGQLPPAHRSFLSALPVFHACGDFLFVHAGVKPGVPLDRQRGGPAVDPGGVPDVGRPLRKGNRPRPYPGAGTRVPWQPDKHRHRRLRHRQAELPVH